MDGVIDFVCLVFLKPIDFNLLPKILLAFSTFDINYAGEQLQVKKLG